MKNYPETLKIVLSKNPDDTEFYFDGKEINFVSAFKIKHNIDKEAGSYPEITLTLYPDKIEIIKDN